MQDRFWVSYFNYEKVYVGLIWDLNVSGLSHLKLGARALGGLRTLRLGGFGSLRAFEL